MEKGTLKFERELKANWLQNVKKRVKRTFCLFITFGREIVSFASFSFRKEKRRGENMENKTFGIASFAILIEAIITYFNQFFVQENFCWQMLFSIALGIVIAVAYKLDLPAHFNLNSQIPYVGCVLTGILLSRGSNYLFDLLNKISKI